MKRTTQIILVLLAMLPMITPAQAKNNFLKYFSGVHHATHAVRGNTLAKTSNVTHLHGKSQNYSWDTISKTWIWNFEAISKYDSKGQATFYAEIGDTTLNDTGYKSITSYDANGSSFSVNYGKNILLLQAIGVDTNLVDNKGGQLRQVSYFRDTTNTKWILASGLQNKITYDANGNMISIQQINYDPSNMIWINTFEDDFTLNADGSWKTETEKVWDGNGWIDQSLIDSIGWKSWNGNPFFGNGGSQLNSAVEKVWNGSSWKDSANIFIAYDANGGSTETDKLFIAGNWVNSTRYIYILDAQDNNTGQKAESWNGSAWDLDFGSLSNYTYDSKENLVMAIDENYNTSTQKYENSTKEVYSDFSTFLAINEANPSNMLIGIFPNPASESIHLQAILPTFEKVDISIYNTQGKVILHEQFMASELSGGLNIPLIHFANGLYILHTVSGKLEINQKFIKE